MSLSTTTTNHKEERTTLSEDPHKNNARLISAAEAGLEVVVDEMMRCGRSPPSHKILLEEGFSLDFVRSHSLLSPKILLQEEDPPLLLDDNHKDTSGIEGALDAMEEFARKNSALKYLVDLGVGEENTPKEDLEETVLREFGTDFVTLQLHQMEQQELSDGEDERDDHLSAPESITSSSSCSCSCSRSSGDENDDDDESSNGTASWYFANSFVSDNFSDTISEKYPIKATVATTTTTKTTNSTFHNKPHETKEESSTLDQNHNVIVPSSLQNSHRGRLGNSEPYSLVRSSSLERSNRSNLFGRLLDRTNTMLSNGSSQSRSLSKSRSGKETLADQNPTRPSTLQRTPSNNPLDHSEDDILIVDTKCSTLPSSPQELSTKIPLSRTESQKMMMIQPDEVVEVETFPEETPGNTSLRVIVNGQSELLPVSKEEEDDDNDESSENHIPEDLISYYHDDHEVVYDPEQWKPSTIPETTKTASRSKPSAITSSRSFRSVRNKVRTSLKPQEKPIEQDAQASKAAPLPDTPQVVTTTEILEDILHSEQHEEQNHEVTVANFVALQESQTVEKPTRIEKPPVQQAPKRKPVEPKEETIDDVLSTSATFLDAKESSSFGKGAWTLENISVVPVGVNPQRPIPQPTLMDTESVMKHCDNKEITRSHHLRTKTTKLERTPRGLHRRVKKDKKTPRPTQIVASAPTKTKDGNDVEVVWKEPPPSKGKWFWCKDTTTKAPKRNKKSKRCSNLNPEILFCGLKPKAEDNEEKHPLRKKDALQDPVYNEDPIATRPVALPDRNVGSSMEKPIRKGNTSMETVSTTEMIDDDSHCQIEVEDISNMATAPKILDLLPNSTLRRKSRKKQQPIPKTSSEAPKDSHFILKDIEDAEKGTMLSKAKDDAGSEIADLLQRVSIFVEEVEEKNHRELEHQKKKEEKRVRSKQSRKPLNDSETKCLSNINEMPRSKQSRKPLNDSETKRLSNSDEMARWKQSRKPLNDSETERLSNSDEMARSKQSRKALNDSETKRLSNSDEMARSRKALNDSETKRLSNSDEMARSKQSRKPLNDSETKRLSNSDEMAVTKQVSTKRKNHLSTAACIPTSNEEETRSEDFPYLGNPNALESPSWDPETNAPNHQSHVDDAMESKAENGLPLHDQDFPTSAPKTIVSVVQNGSNGSTSNPQTPVSNEEPSVESLDDNEDDIDDEDIDSVGSLPFHALVHKNKEQQQPQHQQRTTHEEISSKEQALRTSEDYQPSKYEYVFAEDPKSRNRPKKQKQQQARMREKYCSSQRVERTSVTIPPAVQRDEKKNKPLVPRDRGEKYASLEKVSTDEHGFPKSLPSPMESRLREKYSSSDRVERSLRRSGTKPIPEISTHDATHSSSSNSHSRSTLSSIQSDFVVDPNGFLVDSTTAVLEDLENSMETSSSERSNLASSSPNNEPYWKSLATTRRPRKDNGKHRVSPTNLYSN